MAELPILVCAGNYREFEHWCRQNGTHPREHPPKAIYVSEWHRIRGRRGNPHVTYGTFWDRRDYHEIMEALRAIESPALEDLRDG